MVNIYYEQKIKQFLMLTFFVKCIMSISHSNRLRSSAMAKAEMEIVVAFSGQRPGFAFNNTFPWPYLK